MPRYVAFLRAINVGGHTVKMDRLRTLFEEAGFENVSTFIASGNVIFDAPIEDAKELETQIETRLGASLGYEVDTFVRTPQELRGITGHPPFTVEEVAAGRALYVLLLRSRCSDESASAAAALSTPQDDLRVDGRELYWLCRTRISDSEVNGPALGRALGSSTSMRNMNTVRRILAKLGGGETG